MKSRTKTNGDPYSGNYIHKIVKTSRQAFDFAIAQGLLTNNILSSVRAPEHVSEDRDYEITHELIELAIANANPKYQLIFALARYAGLRCPSELSTLRWGNVQWDRDRFLVHSPKKEHLGSAQRVVPIFSRLLPYLRDAYELAVDGEDRVFPDVDQNSNLRRQTERVLQRSGVTEIVPRFFQNCRSTLQTELEAEFPLHVVCKWLGNSTKTANKHYLKVQATHFEKASGDSLSKTVHETVQKGAATCSEESQAETDRHEKTLENGDSPAFPLWFDYTREDSNLWRKPRVSRRFAYPVER